MLVATSTLSTGTPSSLDLSGPLDDDTVSVSMFISPGVSSRSCFLGLSPFPLALTIFVPPLLRGVH